MKVHDLANLHELTAIIEVDDEESVINGGDASGSGMAPQCSLGWSEDGQLLALVSPRKILHVFLSQLPMTASVSNTGIVARLTSLLEVTLEPLCVSSHFSYIHRQPLSAFCNKQYLSQ